MLIAMMLQMVIKFGELEVVYPMHSRQMTSWLLILFRYTWTLLLVPVLCAWALPGTVLAPDAL